MRQAHAATGLAPLGTGFKENAVQPLRLGLVADRLASGNDQRLDARGDLAPSNTRAAVRRSSIRPLVHEPMNTTSTAISLIGVPGTSPMYSSARRASSGEANGTFSGCGTTPVTSTVMAGFVPQVTCGTRADASIVTRRSNASSSVGAKRLPVGDGRVENCAPRARTAAAPP